MQPHFNFIHNYTILLVMYVYFYFYQLVIIIVLSDAVVLVDHFVYALISLLYIYCETDVVLYRALL